jgi:hypothetical protein
LELSLDGVHLNLGKHDMTMIYKAAAICVGLLMGVDSTAAEPLLTMDRFDEDELRVIGFELTQDGTIEVEAVGARPRYSDHLSAYGWIINAATRDVVWSMDEERTSRDDDSRSLRRVESKLDLKQGRYELYFWAGTMGHGHDYNFGNVSRLLRGSWTNHHNRDDRWELEDAIKDCAITLSSDKLSKAAIKEFEPTGELRNTLLSNNKMRDEEHRETGFELSRDMQLRVYAVIEFPDDWRSPADHAWIRDAASREIVWEMEWRDSDPAGGAKKNRPRRCARTSSARASSYATRCAVPYAAWISAAIRSARRASRSPART